MAATKLNAGVSVQSGSVLRGLLNTTTTGSAVITKVIAGTGITISQTGVDAGTGDVTIGLTPSSSATPTIVQQTAIANNSTNTTATLTASPTAGNLLVAFVGTQSGTLTLGAGWTQINTGNSNTFQTGIYAKTVTATDTAVQTPAMVTGATIATVGILEIAGSSMTAAQLGGVSNIATSSGGTNLTYTNSALTGTVNNLELTAVVATNTTWPPAFSFGTVGAYQDYNSGASLGIGLATGVLLGSPTTQTVTFTGGVGGGLVLGIALGAGIIPTPEYGQTIVNFGVFPGSTDASVTITDPNVQATSYLEANLLAIATPDHSVDEHRIEAIHITAGNIVPSTSFTIYAQSQSNAKLYGAYTVSYLRR